MFLDGKKKEICIAACEATVCSNLSSDNFWNTTINVFIEQGKKFAKEKLGIELSDINKCKACHVACMLFNGKKREICDAACEATICYSSSSDSEGSGDSAAWYAKQQVGKGYSQTNRLG